jgi:hypothetical protein
MADDVPLARRTFWRGNPGLPPQRRTHHTGGIAAVAAVAAWPASTVLSGGAPARVVAVASWGCVAVATAVVALPMTGRESEAGSGPRRPVASGLLVGSLVLVAAALLIAAAAGPEPVLLAEGEAGMLARTQLPGLQPAIVGLFVIQVLLLAALALTILAQRPWRVGGGESGITAYGFAGPAVVLVAWLVAGGFSAGLAFRVVEVLGVAAADAQDAADQRATALAVAADPSRPLSERLIAATAEAPLVLPQAYWWAGLAAFFLVAGLVVLCLALVALVRIRTRRLVPEAAPDYPISTTPGALRRVARAWAVASLTDNAGRFLGRAAAVASMVLLGLLLAYAVLDPALVTEPPLSWATRAGTWLIGLLGLGLVLLMSQTARNPTARRYVGIAWDVGTFWPRAAHPMAPPSYGERAVPDLADRVGRLAPGDGDQVLLSGHSQGSVLVAAALLQLDPAEAAKTGLLTHGSPLRRLYSRFFPAYFGPATLERLRNRPGRGWANLYRRTDPVGSWVLQPQPQAGDTGGVDVRLRDPDPADGRIVGHPDYWFDPDYRRVRGRLLSSG